MLEDMVVHADKTIRDENGRICQFVYGGDYFDARRMIKIGGQGTQFINVKQAVKKIRSNANKREFELK